MTFFPVTDVNQPDALVPVPSSANPSTPVLQEVFQASIPLFIAVNQGKVVYPEGFYEGELIQGIPNGKGKYTYHDGSYHQGQWLNGKRDGMGRFVILDGQTYVGEWLDNEMHGQGTLKFPNGEYYQGKWVFGKRHGFGKSGNSEGVYKGFWFEDKMHGQGEFRYSDGTIYEGQWFFNVRQGQGKLTGKIDTYQGRWEADSRFGYGVCCYANGTKYEGYWQNNQRNGVGKFHMLNRVVFEGKWANDRQNGAGTIRCFSGDYWKGIWVDDLLQQIVCEENTISFISAANSIPLAVEGGVAFFARRSFQNVLRTLLQIKPEKQDLITQISHSLEQCNRMKVGDVLKSIQQGNLTFISAGWTGHTVYLIFYKNQLMICNRGEDRNNYSTIMFRIKTDNLTINTLESLLNYERYPIEQAKHFLHLFPYTLQPEIDDVSTEIQNRLTTDSQKSGNCWYASCKEAIKGAFTLLLLDQGLTPEAAATEAKMLKKLCSAINRLQLLKKYKDKQLQFFSPEVLVEIENKTKKAYNKCIATLGPLSRNTYPWLPKIE